MYLHCVYLSQDCSVEVVTCEYTRSVIRVLSLPVMEMLKSPVTDIF